MNVYNVQIPIKSLTNHDLEYYADKLNIRSFRGSFMKNEIPEQINSTECAIINLDDSSGPGTHWVTYWIEPKCSIYFDSFGLDPPNEIVDYLSRPLHYSTNEIQERDSVICGHLCLTVLKGLTLGKKYNEIIISLI